MRSLQRSSIGRERSSGPTKILSSRDEQPCLCDRGSGFLGRNLIRVLREQGHPVRALARSSKAQTAVQEAGAQPAAGDLDSADALHQGMSDCDVVYHCAAKAEMWGDPAEFHNIFARARGGSSGILN